MRRQCCQDPGLSVEPMGQDSWQRPPRSGVSGVQSLLWLPLFLTHFPEYGLHPVEFYKVQEAKTLGGTKISRLEDSEQGALGMRVGGNHQRGEPYVCVSYPQCQAVGVKDCAKHHGQVWITEG